MTILSTSHVQKTFAKGTSRTLRDNKSREARIKVVVMERKHHPVVEVVEDSGIIKMIMEQLILRTPAMEGTKKMILILKKMHLTLILEVLKSKMMKETMVED